MFAYSALMLMIAALFLVFGILIYKGHTNLIHDYHQKNVKAEDKKAYGEAFARGIFMIACTLAASGTAALFGMSAAHVTVSLTILFGGLIISFIVLWKVQKRFNGGMF